MHYNVKLGTDPYKTNPEHVREISPTSLKRLYSPNLPKHGNIPHTVAYKQPILITTTTIINKIRQRDILKLWTLSRKLSRAPPGTTSKIYRLSEISSCPSELNDNQIRFSFS